MLNEHYCTHVSLNSISSDINEPTHCLIMNYSYAMAYSELIPAEGDCRLSELRNCFSSTPENALSDAQFVCQYATDLCSIHAALCGDHGKCVDKSNIVRMVSGIQCECNFLYGGKFCDHVTRRGIQVLISGVIIFFVTLAHSNKFKKVLKAIVALCQGILKPRRQHDMEYESTSPTKYSNVSTKPTKIASRLEEERRSIRKWKKITTYVEFQEKIMSAMGILRQCQVMTHLAHENLIAFPVSVFALLAFTILMYCSDENSEHGRNKWYRRKSFWFPLPMNPFQMTNRSSTVVIFGILACEVLKVFEVLLFKGTIAYGPMDNQQSSIIDTASLLYKDGISPQIFNSSYQSLMNNDEEIPASSTEIAAFTIMADLAIKIGFVFLIGMRYYPILVCTHLLNNELSKRRALTQHRQRKRIVKTACICAVIGLLYMVVDVCHIVVKEGFCMGFTPVDELMLSSVSHSPSLSNPLIVSTAKLLTEAKMRMQLGHWYLTYGLLKNIPHFIFISFITAQLLVRLVSAWSLYKQVFSTRKNDDMDVLPSICCGLFAKHNTLMWLRWQARRLYNRLMGCYVCTEKLICKPCARFELYETGFSERPESDYQARIIDTDSDDGEINDRYVKRLLSGRKAIYINQHLIMNSSRSCLRRFIDRIYDWNDEFRYSTIAICTYVTTFVFIYYLCCSLVFSFVRNSESVRRAASDATVVGSDAISRFAEQQHGMVLSFYFKHILNIKLDSERSFHKHAIISGIITLIVFSVQLVNSIKQYRSNKLMMFKAVFEDIPSARYLKPNKIVAQSVHYSGFVIGYTAWGFVILFHTLLIIASTISVTLSQRVPLFEIVMTFITPIVVIYILKLLLVRSATRVTFTQGLNQRFLTSEALGGFVGRPLERLDTGFSTYVAFLHTEVAHTHPVVIAFCNIVWNKILKSRGPMDQANSHERILSLSKRRLRFRWCLIYTLVKNINILPFRKDFKRFAASLAAANVNLCSAESNDGSAIITLLTKRPNIYANKRSQEHTDYGRSTSKTAIDAAYTAKAYDRSVMPADGSVPVVIDTSVIFAPVSSNEQVQQSAALYGNGSSAVVFRLASYSERELLWRQKLREKMISDNRHRFAYGCISSLQTVDLNPTNGKKSDDNAYGLGSTHARMDDDDDDDHTYRRRRASASVCEVINVVPTTRRKKDDPGYPETFIGGELGGIVNSSRNRTHYPGTNAYGQLGMAVSITSQSKRDCSTKRQSTSNWRGSPRARLRPYRSEERSLQRPCESEGEQKTHKKHTAV
ncbi:hypothetical protein ACOME3_008842 [Neoechinorhynchus agilis]